ncbi:YjeF N-terminal domain-like protein [Polychaeton citri CBS 116435]|uniref:Enhancer of mRNA-decapping protein 3 n=1 Tax=Polychaeton citri CBS 116435 TaxID=1314669 RepID=A0A9P4UNT4_9PEZI|nr:YjeF N-terminal domain-like protein [Polychaeton citri CBS 116435]
MADFTGMIVRLTLKQPPNTVLHGRVQQVVAGQTLSLVDVQFSNGDKVPHWVVQGAAIADLQVVNTNIPPGPAVRQIEPPQPPPPPPPTQTQPQNGSLGQPTQPYQQPKPARATPQRATSAFVDPAILSFRPSTAQSRIAAKPPTESHASASVPSQASYAPLSQAAAPSTPIKSMLAKAAENLPHPQSSSPFVGEAREPQRHTPQAELSTTPQQGSKPEGADTRDPFGLETGQNEAGSRKKVRRGQKKKPITGENSTQSIALPPPQVMNTEVSRNGNDMNGAMKRGKGWRSTPLLQPTSVPPPAGSSSVRGKTPKKQPKQAEQNGWATEDATDIQDMGDFDFEANHKLFDKKTVFDQLRQGDTTADEDRLVSHNRHRPGTYGGKNLHPTENVLSPTQGAKKSSQADVDSSSDADTEANFNNGRSSSRHSVSHPSLAKKKVPSRQNSQILGETRLGHPLSASMSSERGRRASKPAMSVANRSSRPIPSNVSSPRPDRTHSPQSTISSSLRKTSPVTQLQVPSLIARNSEETCPVLHPSALEMLETETVSRYGISHDAITESAARCIAETALRAMQNPGSTSRRDSRANTIRANVPSNLQMTSARSSLGQPAYTTVVILAGNHTIGARAVAAARHLLPRNCNVIISEASYESSDSYDAQLAAQTAIIKRMQKAGWAAKRGSWKKASQYIKQLPSPPAVIIDALLAGSTYEGLAAESSNTTVTAQLQSEAREMIDWANRSRAPVFSVGCPSGVSGIDGSATIVEGEPLAIRPDKLLALGLPMQGLLEAMKAGERWDVSVADIGINIALRGDDAVTFAGEWVMDTSFVDERRVVEA